MIFIHSAYSYSQCLIDGVSGQVVASPWTYLHVKSCGDFPLNSQHAYPDCKKKVRSNDRDRAKNTSSSLSLTLRPVIIIKAPHFTFFTTLFHTVPLYFCFLSAFLQHPKFISFVPPRALVKKWFVSLGHNPSHNLLVISTCPGATVLFPFHHAPPPNAAARVTNCTTLAGSLSRFNAAETSLRNFCWRSSSTNEGRAKFSVGGINPAVHVHTCSLNALKNRARPRSHPPTRTHTHPQAHTHTHTVFADFPNGRI